MKHKDLFELHTLLYLRIVSASKTLNISSIGSLYLYRPKAGGQSPYPKRRNSCGENPWALATSGGNSKY